MLPMFKECGYSKRQARESPLFQLLQDHWRDFTAEYSEYFEPEFGYLRTRVETVVGQFLECGLLDFGFARIRCEQCKLELFLPFSCKSRTFCPSCAANASCFLKNFFSKRFLSPTSPTVMSCSPSPSDCEDSFFEIAICWPTFRAWATSASWR